MNEEEFNNRKLDEDSLEKVNGGYAGIQDPAYAIGTQVYYRYGGSELYIVSSCNWAIHEKCYTYGLYSSNPYRELSCVAENDLSYLPFISAL